MKTIPDVQPIPWRDYCWDPPYRTVPLDEVIEICRDEWTTPQRITQRDMPHWLNVAGLSWRRL